jgi:hypothetical protein
VRKNTRSQMLIKLTARILDIFRKQGLDDVTAGIRFDAPESQWRAGYGVPFEKELPDFVKEDNAGWTYVKKQDK